MKLFINSEPIEGSAYSLSYPSDILDGILIDMPENYIFLSDHVEEHRAFMEEIEDPVEHFDLTKTDVNYAEPPHSWVVRSVGRLLVATAEVEVGNK